MNESIVVVTGAAGALGSQVAEFLANGGLIVVGIDKAETLPQSKAMALALGGVDLVDENSTRAAFGRIKDALESIDGLVNIAGGFRWEKVADGSVETWDLLYRMN